MWCWNVFCLLSEVFADVSVDFVEILFLMVLARGCAVMAEMVVSDVLAA